MLVLAVTIAAIAAPSLTGTMARVRLDAAAEQVRDAWAQARLQAIRAGEPVAFQAQLGTGDFRLFELQADPAAAAAQPTPAQPAPAPATQDDPDEGLGDVVFTQVSAGAPDAPATDPTLSACIVFRADGSTDDAFAVIQAADGRRRTIALRGLTGAARITDDAQAEVVP